MTTRRILITGSRDWEDGSAIRGALWDWWCPHCDSEYGDTTILVSGACSTGADVIAERLFSENECMVERHPADWNEYGRAAGFIRNKEMVDLGADVCLAFIRNSSKGATHTADLAEAAGIPTRRFIQND